VSNRVFLCASAAVLAAAGTAAALVAARPASYRVSRSERVAAPPPVVLAEVSDLRRWSSWTSWPRREAGSQQTYGGPAAGVGASVYWARPGAAVERLSVVAVTAERVELELARAASESDVEVSVAADGAGTRVSWTVEGTRGATFLARARTLLSGGERTLGREIEAALAGLRMVAEAQAKVAARRVERSITVAAPPPAVLAVLADLHRWQAWSPWGGEANVHRAFGGPAAGVGASCYWSVDGRPERGRATIVAAGASRLDVELEVPGQPPRDLELRVVADGAGSRVTWVMPGEEDAAGAIAALLDRGLAQLKSAVEAQMLAAK
jgi:polyketide cyclase/dehydrase/lipid transport protein